MGRRVGGPGREKRHLALAATGLVVDPCSTADRRRPAGARTERTCCGATGTGGTGLETTAIRAPTAAAVEAPGWCWRHWCGENGGGGGAGGTANLRPADRPTPARCAILGESSSRIGCL